MMKTILTTIVGGIILFTWQMVSWQVLKIHSPQTSYTAYQDKILEVLDDLNIQEGEYVLPTYQPNASKDEVNAYMEKYMGKPWATLRYQKKLSNEIGMNLFRGIVMNILIVFSLCLLIGLLKKKDFKTIFMVCLGFGLMSYCINPYLYSIWFNNTTIPELIDAVVQFSLLGAWLGFMLRTKEV